MGFFNFFKKKKNASKGITNVFEEMRLQEEGKKLTNQGISYRNLGEYEKAMKIFMEAITKFSYMPAITYIGTTAILKGDIDGAIKWFEISIKKPPKGSNYMEFEWQNQLGLIYLYHKNDPDEAKNKFEAALRAPKPDKISDEIYKVIISETHRNLAAAHLLLGELDEAYFYAMKRLAVDPDCEKSQKIVSVCVETRKSNNFPF